MAPHCEPFPGKRVVLVTVNMDYFDMFTNWLGSARDFLHETEHLHVIAEEAEAVAPLQALLEEQKLDYSVSPPDAPSMLISFQPPWNSAGYGSVVWERPNHIMNLLQVGCSVLYADIDAVWMKDPFPEIDAVGSADLYLSGDWPAPEEQIIRNYCTCFMYFHPGVRAMSLLQNWAANASGNSNQKIFNSVLKDMVEANAHPTIGLLPMQQFPPGMLVLKPGASELLPDAPPDPTVYHANYRIGNAHKIKFFEVLGLWSPAHRDL